jgi:uroporphyrinogen III methyltransferase/synthase
MPDQAGADAALPGRVYLVGAGPGDPGLITARALALIASADVILHDRLIPAEALSGARPDAELLFVGKEGGGASVPQGETEALMVARAQAGLSVVRLKGGDPFVFGRGGEEAATLRGAGIGYEVVPGITAGVAASAYAGIPVTHREHASAVALVTGHTRDDDEADARTTLDWDALAAFPGTLVFYMGVRRLPEIARSLIASGRPPDQPAAVVERGTLPDQREVIATLETIAAAASAAGIRPPSITVVGPVVGLAHELAWRDPAPLAGLSVAVTRARTQASSLAHELTALGARVVQAPVIRTLALEVTAPEMSGYDLVCVTSPNGVHLLFAALAASGRDARALGGARVAAIGPATVRALAEHGVIADVVPESFVAEALTEALAGAPVRRALIARARQARDVLPDALRERGAQVDVLDLYETVAEPLDAPTLASARDCDYITFTSSSTVNFFLQAAGGESGLAPHTRVVSIGPVTTATLREHGIPVHIEAGRHDVDGVVAAVLADATATGARDGT